MNIDAPWKLLLILTLLSVSPLGCKHAYQRWSPKKENVEELLHANRDLKAEAARPNQDRDAQSIYQSTTFNAIRAVQRSIDPEQTKKESETFVSAMKRGLGEHLYHDLKIKGSSAGPGKLMGDRAEGKIDKNLLKPFSIEHAKLAELNRIRIKTLYENEHRVILNRRPNTSPASPYIGLALSGGGIRSASFCGGVLRALHERHLLDEFGYLSTVSGGGYVGGWFMTHGGKARTETIDGQDHDIPGNKRIFAPGSPDLRQLIQNGQYLIQGHFSDKSFSIIKIVSTHILTLPFYLVFDRVIDLDKNISLIKRYYRISIAKAFLYLKTSSAQIDYQGNVSKKSLFVKDNIIHPMAQSSMKNFLPKKSNNLPFWIINMHLSLKDDESPNYRNRSGDAFEITPLKAGADSVGYVKVPKEISSWYSVFTSPSTYWMTPEFSVAISGAAADSKSFKQSGFFNSFLDALNINLGYFVDSWGSGWTEEDSFVSGFVKDFRFYVTANPVSRFIPNDLPIPILGSIIGFFSAEEDHDVNRTAKRYFLTDGGHFDNLGLYSLIRRGCRLIVIADGEQDSYVNKWEYNNNANRAKAFESLRALEEKLMTDFGVQIEFEWNNFRVPSASGDNPQDDELLNATESEVLVGRIKNLPLNLEGAKITSARNEEAYLPMSRTEDPGVTILYFKSAYDPHKGLRKSTSFLDREVAETPEFPNESTANQWFSERKVLSYHQLGRELVLRNSKRIRDEINKLKDKFK